MAEEELTQKDWTLLLRFLRKYFIRRRMKLGTNTKNIGGIALV
jgi:hypothetical protein